MAYRLFELKEQIFTLETSGLFPYVESLPKDAKALKSLCRENGLPVKRASMANLSALVHKKEQELGLTPLYEERDRLTAIEMRERVKARIAEKSIAMNGGF